MVLLVLIIVIWCIRYNDVGYDEKKEWLTSSGAWDCNGEQWQAVMSGNCNPMWWGSERGRLWVCKQFPCWVCDTLLPTIFDGMLTCLVNLLWDRVKVLWPMEWWSMTFPCYELHDMTNGMKCCGDLIGLFLVCYITYCIFGLRSGEILENNTNFVCYFRFWWHDIARGVMEHAILQTNAEVRFAPHAIFNDAKRYSAFGPVGIVNVICCFV